MIDALQQAISFEHLWWLCLGGLIAGVVRGFAGFGTAMIYLPFAGQVLDPIPALITLMVIDIIGPAALIPRAVRDGHPGDVGRLILGCFIVLPFAIALLVMMSPEVFRYAVSAVALVLLALLMAGVRYRGRLKPWMLYLTGGIGGFLGGTVGVPGPPVIMIYMASTHPPAVIRANNMLYLWIFDFALLAIFVVRGWLTWFVSALGLIVAVPYLIGNLIGSWIFDPEKEQMYRRIAYLIIGISAVRGLPIWG